MEVSIPHTFKHGNREGIVQRLCIWDTKTLTSADGYAEQLLEDIERPQEVAARIGLGFEIPEPSFVPNVPETPELEAVAVAA